MHFAFLTDGALSNRVFNGGKGSDEGSDCVGRSILGSFLTKEHPTFDALTVQLENASHAVERRTRWGEAAADSRSWAYTLTLYPS